MTQLVALIWLKWKLFRNSLRSRKAALSRAASALATLAALGLALLVSFGLGFMAYTVTPFDLRSMAGPSGAGAPTIIFLFFTTFAVLYLMWATVPLSIGGDSQFEPGRLLLYPVSLRKLFALDYLSELTSLSSIFAIPAVTALALGAGLRNGRVLMALGAGACATLFGIALAKWLSTSVGALMRRRRTRGETLVALIGVVIGLTGAFAGRFVELVTHRGDVFPGLRWTPPGAIAVALVSGLQRGGTTRYALALLTLLFYTAALVLITYWIARRSALGMGGARRAAVQKQALSGATEYVGWQLPLLPAEVTAIVEKELRNAMRNAQLRIMALMPLILIAIRVAQTSGRMRRNGLPTGMGGFTDYLVIYGEGLMAMGGVLYVFMILSSLSFNQFAYEGAGMRALILSPMERRKILIGKNISVTLLALLFSTALLTLNQIVFRDQTWRSFAFVALCFILFAALFALVGNWFSMRFPRRLRFGKRMNASGVTGLLLIPVMLGMALPPIVAALAGYLAGSLIIKYVTLAAFAAIALLLYSLLIKAQGRTLARRERDILEAVSGRNED